MKIEVITKEEIEFIERRILLFEKEAMKIKIMKNQLLKTSSFFELFYDMPSLFYPPTFDKVKVLEEHEVILKKQDFLFEKVRIDKVIAQLEQLEETLLEKIRVEKIYLKKTICIKDMQVAYSKLVYNFEHD